MLGNSKSAGSLVLAIVLVFLPALVRSAAPGQSQTSAAPAQPNFDAASLKERDPRVPLGLVGIQKLPGRLISRCATLKSLLFYAYDLNLSSRIEGLPTWANTPCADGLSADTYEFQATMRVDAPDADTRQMMQSFLRDRFKLRIHWENRVGPVFALTVAPEGFKMKPSDPQKESSSFPQCPADDPGCRRFGGGSGPISELASLLGFALGRPVIDKTGLKGTYPLDLRWAGDNSPNSSLPPLPTALREAFGLVLKSEKGSVRAIIVDHAERPSPN
jgi:uncharacterized protein (TIGR03435 family)